MQDNCRTTSKTSKCVESIIFKKHVVYSISFFKRYPLKYEYLFLSLNCSCQFNSNSNCRQLLLLGLLRPFKMIKRQYYRYFLSKIKYASLKLICGILFVNFSQVTLFGFFPVKEGSKAQYQYQTKKQNYYTDPGRRALVFTWNI